MNAMISNKFDKIEQKQNAMAVAREQIKAAILSVNSTTTRIAQPHVQTRDHDLRLENQFH